MTRNVIKSIDHIVSYVSLVRSGERAVESSFKLPSSLNVNFGVITTGLGDQFFFPLCFVYSFTSNKT